MISQILEQIDLAISLLISLKHRILADIKYEGRSYQYNGTNHLFYQYRSSRADIKRVAQTVRQILTEIHKFEGDYQRHVSQERQRKAGV